MVLPILLIIFVVFYTILVWRRLDFALYGLIFGLWSYVVRFDVLSIPITLLEIMILLVFGVWLIKNRKQAIYRILDLGKQLKIPFAVALFCFILAATIAVFVSPDIKAAAGIWKAYFIEPILLLIVFLDTIKTRRMITNVILSLSFSILVPSTLAIYQYGTGNLIINSFWQAIETRRVTSFYGYPNAIGLYFAPICALLIAVLAEKIRSVFITKTSPKTNWEIIKVIVISLSILFGGLSIVFAQSKGAILALGAALTIYMFCWRKLRVLFASILIAGSIGLVLFVPHLTSFEGTRTTLGGGSLEIRLDQWKETLTMLQERPLFGAGLSGYQDRVAPFHQKEHIEIFMYPHQILLNFWTEIGLLGLAAFIFIVVWTYRQSYWLEKTYSINTLPVVGGLTALLVHGLVDVPYFKNDLSVLFWILVGLVLLYYLNSKQLVKNSNN